MHAVTRSRFWQRNVADIQKLGDDESKAYLEQTPRSVANRKAVIVLLTSKRLADITNFEGKALLKEELVDRMNAVLQQSRVRSVLFTEFVIQ